MAQTSLGDLRRQLNTLLQEAKLSNYKLEDLLPPDAFQSSVNELTKTKEYLKEVEEREKALQQENEELHKALTAEKKKVEDIPDDYKALQVDYKQAEKRIEYYKGLMEREEERAQTYYNNWMQASKNSVKVANTNKALDALKIENEQQKATIIKLVEQNRAAGDMVAQLREEEEATLEEKNQQLAAMRRFVSITECQYQQLEEESEDFEKAYHDLVNRLGEENGDVAAALNKATAKARRMERVQIATICEAKSLCKFLNASFQVLNIFEEIFQQLLSTDKDEPNVRWLPDDLQHVLGVAGSQIEAYDEMHRIFNLEGLELDNVRGQLMSMAGSAKSTHETLWMIALDVKEFLTTLKQKPDVWKFVRSKLGKSCEKP